VPIAAKPTTFQEAFAKAGKVVRETSARTLKVVQKGMISVPSYKQFQAAEMFYKRKKGEPFTYIEKPKYAIKEPRELIEIPYKGLAVKKQKAFLRSMVKVF